MKSIITWFEIPAKNMYRAKKFYQEIVQMKLTKFEQGGHSLIMFPFDGKHVSGALVQADSTYPHPSDNGVHIFSKYR